MANILPSFLLQYFLAIMVFDQPTYTGCLQEQAEITASIYILQYKIS